MMELPEATTPRQLGQRMLDAIRLAESEVGFAQLAIGRALLDRRYRDVDSSEAERAARARLASAEAALADLRYVQAALHTYVPDFEDEGRARLAPQRLALRRTREEAYQALLEEFSAKVRGLSVPKGELQSEAEVVANAAREAGQMAHFRKFLRSNAHCASIRHRY